MKRLAPILAIALAAALWLAPAAQAEFGVKTFGVTFSNEDGSPDTQAGSHPFAMDTYFELNSAAGQPDGLLKDDSFQQIPGFVGDATAIPRCSAAEFIHPFVALCAPGDQVGIIDVHFGLSTNGTWDSEPVYNLAPPPGVPARIGFIVAQVPVVIDVGVKQSPPYNVFGFQTDVPKTLPVFGARLQLWGNPADPAHDPFRPEGIELENGFLDHAPCGGFAEFSGKPSAEVGEAGFAPDPPGCPSSANNPKPFLTLPRSCTGPALSSYALDSWEVPGSFLPTGEPDLTDPAWAQGSALTHDFSEPPNPQGFTGCGKLGFNPSIAAKPTTKAATSPTGLDFSLDVKDEGLTSPEGLANSDIRKAVVTLPEGMTANPSIAEGLEVCSEEDLRHETLGSPPGAGCPEASKIGTIEVQTPLLGESVKGALYQAKPYENLAEDALIAFYIVIKNPAEGILVKQPVKVAPDPHTGQLITTTEEIPQLPFSHFKLHFREGGRSPLISPPDCGAFDGHDPAHEPVKATLYPWAGGEPVTSTSAFEIVSGPDEGPCPPGGVSPFHPGFEAGSINNNAGSYSPFYMHLTRADGEQDMTKFSTVLPPGVVGKIAGVSKCPESGIAQAKARTGSHGAQEELEHPSCPASSKIGRTLAGAGVGSELTYVPGSLYLAGPVAGDPLSVVSITPAKAGPFDVGDVVVREALTLNPNTAEVEVDGSHSDPIPHILKGIPLNVRDLRVYADKPNFTLNPTSCTPSSARATLWGGGTTFLPTGETLVGLSSRFQAANCASLGFKPEVAIALQGGTKRGKFPALTATVTPRPGDANFSGAVVTLPHSAFLEQGHFKTICTRVQFAASGGNGAGCPAASVYGHATATSPLLEEPLSGPVYLRSSNHNLPDLVVALHGLVNIDLASRIDSFKGGIRSSFEAIPDAPVSKFVLEMEGGAKGLIVNSTNLCGSVNRAKGTLIAQSGKVDRIAPAVTAKCPKHRKGKARHKRHRRHRHRASH